MEEVTNTRLICIGCDDDFQMKWIRKIIDTNPSFDGDKLSFVIIGSNSRVEISTMDFNRLENVAKRITSPKGRSAISTDKAYIYIKEVGGHEKLLGVLTHKRVKSFAPMHDKVGYR
jgi:hypothetical protein